MLCDRSQAGATPPNVLQTQGLFYSPCLRFRENSLDLYPFVINSLRVVRWYHSLTGVSVLTLSLTGLPTFYAVPVVAVGPVPPVVSVGLFAGGSAGACATITSFAASTPAL